MMPRVGRGANGRWADRGANMSTAASGREANQGDYSHAAVLVREGKSKADIIASLVGQGLDMASATTVVEELFAVQAKAASAAAKRNMLIGGLWCIGGTVVTVLTYQAAANNPGGGSYVVAWGAIIFGAFQFLRGVFQSIGNR